jgi:hypothetical protein
VIRHFPNGSKQSVYPKHVFVLSALLLVFTLSVEADEIMLRCRGTQRSTVVNNNEKTPVEDVFTIDSSWEVTDEWLQFRKGDKNEGQEIVISRKYGDALSRSYGPGYSAFAMYECKKIERGPRKFSPGVQLLGD